MRYARIGSVAVHGVLIALATARATGPRVERPERERLEVVRLDQPVDAKPAPPPVELAAAAALGFQILVAPVEIPTTIPPVDVALASTDGADFSGRGVAGGFASGLLGGLLVGNVRPPELIDDDEAEDRAYMLPGQMGPAYPEALRSHAPDGTVMVRFVLDTTGRLEPPSLYVVRTSHPLFTDAVRHALERLRFSPAAVGGRKVRVRMEQRFEFHLAGR